MIATCAEALLLRDYLLRRLGNGTGSLSPAEVERLRNVSAAGWQLFLSEEGCAAVVQQELTELELLESLSRNARKEIKRLALAEAQRALSVRHQIAEVAKIAREKKWRVVILKGGVGVAESSDVLYITDLDVLTTPEVAPDLARELIARGYRGGDEQHMHHLTPSVAEGGVTIEIHREWDPDARGVEESWWRNTRVLRQGPPLERPGDADHLWHMLVHGVEQHPERRGRLRDALLTWRVWAACTAADLAEVERRVAAHASRGALREVLDFVRGLNEDVRSDPLRSRAAARYALRWMEMHMPVPGWIRGQLRALTLSLVDGPRELGYYVRRVLPTIWRGDNARGDEARPRTISGIARVTRRLAAQLVVVIIAPFVAFIAMSALGRR
jgi:hypothetical protein